MTVSFKKVFKVQFLNFFLVVLWFFSLLSAAQWSVMLMYTHDK